MFKTPQKQILKENIGLNNGVGSDQQGVIKDLKKQLTAENQEKAKLKIEVDKMERQINQFKDKLQVSFSNLLIFKKSLVVARSNVATLMEIINLAIV